MPPSYHLCLPFFPFYDPVSTENSNLNDLIAPADSTDVKWYMALLPVLLPPCQKSNLFFSGSFRDSETDDGRVDPS